MLLAEKVADEMVEHLVNFGYAADKVHRPDNHNVIPHISGCTLYTRWPWDVYYKARKAGQMAEKSMSMIHDSAVDLKGLNRKYKDVYMAGNDFLREKKDRATDFAENNADMWAKFDKFHDLATEQKDEMMDYFKTKRPSNYGNYDDVKKVS